MASMRKRGERILGPFEQPATAGRATRWRIIVVRDDGSRVSSVHKTEREAERAKELLEAELAAADHTTETALDEYEKHITSLGWKPRSIEGSVYSIRAFFPDPIPLSLLSAKRCRKLYDDLRTRTTKTGKPASVDTHRNALNRAKSMLAFCVERGWIPTNPLDGVKGVGKRRPRGLSLGKEGNELRVKQARAWYEKALALASTGDKGAIAGLVALLLGMRATEIVTRTVNDIDTDEQPGDLLWIPCSKTPAGRRTLEVPMVLRPLLVRCCEGKSGERHLFERYGRRHHRDYVRNAIKRICDLAGVPRVTAHAMRSALATITAERGLAGHLIAATLGHADERITMKAYAAPGAAEAGDRRKGLVVLQGGRDG